MSGLSSWRAQDASTVHFTVLSCTALYSDVLRCTAMYYTAMHCTLYNVQASPQECLAVTESHPWSPHCTLHCTSLHCKALYLNIRHYNALYLSVPHCTVPQCTALHCIMIQPVYVNTQESTIDFNSNWRKPGSWRFGLRTRLTGPHCAVLYCRDARYAP